VVKIIDLIGAVVSLPEAKCRADQQLKQQKQELMLGLDGKAAA
jgi:hypothetical protein